jgi:hypothetical protein
MNQPVTFHVNGTFMARYSRLERPILNRLQYTFPALVAFELPR